MQILFIEETQVGGYQITFSRGEPHRELAWPANKKELIQWLVVHLPDVKARKKDG